MEAVTVRALIHLAYSFGIVAVCFVLACFIVCLLERRYIKQQERREEAAREKIIRKARAAERVKARY